MTANRPPSDTGRHLRAVDGSYMGAHDPRREAYDRARREALRAWEAEDQSEDAAYSGWRLVLRLALYLLIVALGLIGWGGIFWLVLS